LSDYNFTLNDLNNYCGADRKLIINDSYEFWIHDIALTKTSNYFKKILTNKNSLQIREEIVFVNGFSNLKKKKKKKKIKKKKKNKKKKYKKKK